MGLVVSVVLVERVVQVTIDPGELRDVAKEERHLSHFSILVVVPLSNRIKLLVEIRVYNFITPVVVWFSLMPEITWVI
jgi:hypothetical protein